MSSISSRKKTGQVKYVEPYDFRHPKLFSKEIMRTLRTLHDVLARSLSRVFSSALRRKVDVHLQGIDQISTTEFVHQINSPSVIYVLNVEELGGDMIVVFPAGFCIHLIERQSGGSNDDLSEARTLTTIEEKIVSRVMKSINREIIIAWEPYMDFNIDSTIYESKPENIHLVSVDPTIIARFSIDLGSKEVDFEISYPYSLLKKAMNNSILNNNNQSKAERLSEEKLEAYKQTLLKANVKVQPLLGSTKMSIRDIIDMKEGDAIPLKQRADQPLSVNVNGVRKMTAYPGTVQGRRAIRIYDLIEEINELELL